MNVNIHQWITYRAAVILFFIVCMHLSYSCTAQNPHFTKHYSIEDGLDQRIIRKVLRDQDYKTWIFSDVGVQLYDGKAFEFLNVLDGIDMEAIYQIDIVDSVGILLLGPEKFYQINTSTEVLTPLNKSDDEFLYVTNGKLVSYDTIDKQLNIEGKYYDFKALSSNPVKIYNHKNEISILTESSIMYILHDQEKLIKIENVNDVLGYINDQCYYIKNEQLYRYHDGVEHLYNTRMTAIRKGIITHDKSGNTLLGVGDHRSRIKELYLYTNESIQDYSKVASKVNTIRDYYSDDFRKEILLATYNGLIYQSFSPYIESVLSDKSYMEGGFGQVVWWIINRTKTNELYFTKETEGVYQYANKKAKNLLDSNKQLKVFVSNYFAFYDEGNDLLFSSSFGNDNSFFIWDFEKSVIEIKTDIRIRCFAKLNENQIILAGAVGKKTAISIYNIKKKKITKNYILGELRERIHSISIDNDLLTFTTDKNVSTLKLDFDKFDNNIFDVQNLIECPTLDHKFINNHLIIGTYGDGAYIMDSNNHIVKRLNVANGLAGNIVHSVNEDSKGHIWLGTFKGISVLDSNFNIIKNIRKEDGLSTNEFNTHSFAEINNQIFMGSINGMNIIDYGILESNSFSNLIPEETTYTKNGIEYSQKIKHEISPDIPFEIDSIDIKYKDYRLYRSFNNEDYIFEHELYINNERIKLNKLSLPVTLDNKDIPVTQLVDGKSDVLTLNKESFIEKYGLILLLLCTVIALIYLLFRLNNKRVSEGHQKRLLAMQSRLDNMRSSALRAQMNPHFIFNALGSIQYHIQRQDTELAEEYLSDFAILMRHILESSKNDFVKISEELEMLKLYVKLEHLRFDKKFDYSFNIDEDLDQTLELPSMIIQPFIENAINHGLYHLIDKKGLLEIKLWEDESGQINCLIQDNGVGRKASSLKTTKKHKSRAIGIINERMKLLGEQTNQAFSIEIEDILNESEIIGTRAMIRFGFFE